MPTKMPALSAAAGLLAFCNLALAGAPTVSQVRAVQRPTDSKLIDILYNLTDPDNSLCTVWVLVSNNGGSTWSIPARTFNSGSAAGPNVTPGQDKSIVWNAGADAPGLSGSIRIRVYADDGNGMARMAYVGSGPFPYQGGSNIQVNAFWIDKCEVTNQRYCEYLNAADPVGTHWVDTMKITKNGSVYAVMGGWENYPVYYVSYDDAAAFAAWLSAREGRSYRLPTEQEWEKAASWNPQLQRRYVYGFQQDTIDCSWCNYHNGTAYCVGGPTPVGYYDGTGGRNKAESPYGCYDMSGNLWEWTSSWYTVNQYRVIRGGSWLSDAALCACTDRSIGTPSGRINFIGFRLVLDP